MVVTELEAEAPLTDAEFDGIASRVGKRDGKTITRR